MSSSTEQSPAQAPAPLTATLFGDAPTQVAPEQSAAFQPAAAPWGGIDDPWTLQDTNGERPWYHAIPDQATRELMQAKGYKNPVQASMAYRNLLQHQGGSPHVVALPQDGWGDTEWAQYRERIGAGATPEDYAFERKPDVAYDDAAMAWLQDIAHKHALPKKVVQDLVDGEGGWNAMMAARMESEIKGFQEANEAAIEKLKLSWGDQLSPMVAAGRRAIQALGLDNATLAALETTAGAAAVIDLLARIGSKTSEGAFKGGDAVGDPSDPRNLEPAQAAAQAQTAMSSPAYADKHHPEHKAVVDRVRRLMERSMQGA